MWNQIKISFVLLLVFTVFTVEAQIVNIPDINLKDALVNNPHADLGNGFFEDVDTNNDGEIQVSEAEAVIGLYIYEQSISDLEGLQYFVNMELLACNANYLIQHVPSTYFPYLKELYCGSNDIFDIDVTQNPLLELLHCSSNELSELNLTQNLQLIEFHVTGNHLTELDISQNIQLEELWCNGNQLSELDLLQNINLEFLICENNFLSELDVSHISNISTLGCGQNELTSLNIKNGNNENLINMDARNNQNLNCIQVDEEEYANSQTTWYKDEWASYSEDCHIGLIEEFIDSFSIHPNPVDDILYIDSDYVIKKIIIFDLLGNIILASEEDFDQLFLSDFTSGVYIIEVESEIATNSTKFIKK